MFRSDRLVKWRKRKKLTQEQLAIKVNITKASISNYENGHSAPPHETLVALADFFGITTDYLLGRTNATFPQVKGKSNHFVLGIGERIKKLREQTGLNQLELSKKIGMNNSVLSRIESGKRPVEHDEINQFADFFMVTGDYLLGRTDPDMDNNLLNSEYVKLIKNPEETLFFREYLESSEECKKELRHFWKIIKDAEKGRKLEDRQGE
ncbi:helix-turn-helix domain-containing protein [Paenibacillus sp. MER 180]|uniref:helix-turn-helix domain-containing protein n=1 Tax=Paenibacillus sp. MER 180 TaxID=2939570 RepID=UPI00203B83C2|nr:helix-turn-helix transcriptional regulator [Paenibacillus sp. MER 180]MCM3292362.1 helix-turn-helix domain-containing protein [Paenibacillus sp. MER 180]